MPREEYRARIPDEDAYNWIKTLLEGGFSTQEVDNIMMHLNDTYVEKIKGKVLVDTIVEESENYMASMKVEITEELRQHLREWAIEKIRQESR